LCIFVDGATHKRCNLRKKERPHINKTNKLLMLENFRRIRRDEIYILRFFVDKNELNQGPRSNFEKLA
jgi:hypothetical protein